MVNIPYTSLDYALADFLTDRCGFKEAQRERFNALVLALSSAQGAGHSCIEISDEDLLLLKDCRLVYSATHTLEETVNPLVIEDNRFYLTRYWRYEKRLVENILKRITKTSQQTGNEALLDKYFPIEKPLDEIDWQREAASAAAKQAFTIITGGPGTGKTSTVLKILAQLQELHNGELAISVAAPTGKAAMRLQQSLLEGKQRLSFEDQRLYDSVPETVSTLHRLLGSINRSSQFRHHASKPLSCDLLVIDESSMIDLAMMSKLLDALHPSARIILLGDKDQLASVESGAVLNDLCESLPQQTIELKKTWRFSGPIKSLAQAINAQEADHAWDLLSHQTDGAEVMLSFKQPAKPTSQSVEPVGQQQYSLFDPPSAEAKNQPVATKEKDVESTTANGVTCLKENWLAHIDTKYQPYINQIKSDNDPEAALEAFSRFQVLAAVRQGTFGVEGINRALEKRFYSSQLQTHLPWYHGKPVMITRNDPSLGLFNGDIGLCLYDSDADQLRVWFKETEGHFRAIIPGRLPQHETVFAMTIHKSQGSEFEHVAIVLPDKPVPLLSRELLYTGVTRAKKQVDIAASELVFKYTVNQQVVRHSGIISKIQAAMVEY